MVTSKCQPAQAGVQGLEQRAMYQLNTACPLHARPSATDTAFGTTESGASCLIPLLVLIPVPHRGFGRTQLGTLSNISPTSSASTSSAKGKPPPPRFPRTLTAPLRGTNDVTIIPSSGFSIHQVFSIPEHRHALPSFILDLWIPTGVTKLLPSSQPHAITSKQTDINSPGIKTIPRNTKTAGPHIQTNHST